jgi:hypothetical protein
MKRFMITFEERLVGMVMFEQMLFCGIYLNFVLQMVTFYFIGRRIKERKKITQ